VNPISNCELQYQIQLQYQIKYELVNYYYY